MKFLEVIKNLKRGYHPLKDKTSDGIDPHVVAFSDAYSQVGEQYRVVTSKLSTIEDLQTILITSSLPQEGKTTTACNLAATFASSLQKKTVIVDADLRRPKIHELLGCDQEPGLSDIIEGRCSIQEVVANMKVRNLSVIPSGRLTANPDQLLNSNKIQEVFNQLKEIFDYVVVDSPPVLKTSDVHALGKISDYNIFVVKAQVTPAHIVKEATESIKGTPAEANCCMMTNVEKVPDYYSYLSQENYRDYYKPNSNYVAPEANELEEYRA